MKLTTKYLDKQAIEPLRKNPGTESFRDFLFYKFYRLEQVYVSGITYIKPKQRTHYLSLITDAYLRKIVGQPYDLPKVLAKL